MSLSTAHLCAELASGDMLSEALTRRCLDQIQARDAEIGAFLDVDRNGALEQARAVDQRRAAGESLPAIAGMPVAIKDNINQKGQRTTCASHILEAFTSPYDAHVIERLRTQGAVLIGKTNLDEFAMGSSTEHSALGRTANPVNLERTPGGSSGGSAAAVAADMAPLALGSDTGGSIRQPAAFCGVVGMKPSYGRVSRYGLTAFGSSLDQIGPFAHDVAGAALLYDAIAGHDSRDSTSVDRPTDDVFSTLGQTVAPPRIGVLRDFGDDVQPEIKQVFDDAVAALREAGAEVRECRLPHLEYAIPAYYLIATAEASSNLARYDGLRYTKRAEDVRNLADMYVETRSAYFGDEVKRRILLGVYALSSGYYDDYYGKAQKVRALIAADLEQVFQDVDALLTPTTPTTAFAFGDKLDDPVSMYLSDIFTVTANLAGTPAISLPCGQDQDGLPIGLQLMGARFEDAALLRQASFVEQVLRKRVVDEGR